MELEHDISHSIELVIYKYWGEELFNEEGKIRITSCIQELINIYKKKKNTDEIQQKTTPFVCPVCMGKKKLPNGFYNSIGLAEWTVYDNSTEPCQSCNATGIVWN